MKTLAGTLLGLSLASAAVAQPAPTTIVSSVGGTRLDIAATGEVARVPDIALISAGVMTRAATAGEAIRSNAERIESVRAALRRAGVAERDLQTSTLSLNPDYRYDQNQPPQLTGYNASNQLTIRFRDIRRAGAILDALVAAGANTISGPSFTLDKPEEALDEARTKALGIGRARAELYARSLGMRVVRLVSVSEYGGGYAPPPPPPPATMSADAAAVSRTEIVPGEQRTQVTLSMSFELR